MKPTDKMTFGELMTEILQAQPTAVEIEHKFIMDTHVYATAQREIVQAKIDAGVDPKTDPETIRTKREAAQVVGEIRAGRVCKIKTWTFNQYFK